MAFNRLSGYADDAAEFWNEKAESLSLAAADPIALASGQARTGVNAQLDTGGSLTGTITDSVGNPLNRCLVQAYTRDGELVTRLGMSHHGSFSIGGLTSGQYYVRVLSPRNTNGECDGGRQWLGQPVRRRVSRPRPSPAPCAVTITQGATTTVGNPLVYKRGATHHRHGDPAREVTSPRSIARSWSATRRPSSVVGPRPGGARRQLHRPRPASRVRTASRSPA